MLGRRPLVTIGELDQRVDLQRRSDDPAAGGGTTETYTTIATVWAKVEAVSGSLYFASQQVQETATHAVTIRLRTDWQSIEYIRWAAGLSARSFRIERVRQLDPEYQEFLCEEIEQLPYLTTGSGNVIRTESGDIVTVGN